MSFNARLKNNQLIVAATAATGAIGTVVAGTALQSQKLRQGSVLCAEVAMVIATGSVTLTPSWQGSIDNSTWKDLTPLNNAANVSVTATATKVITTVAPLPFRYVRAIATVGGATATAADTVAIKYHYVETEV